MGRTPCCDKSKVKKGPWSVEEDELLKNFIMNFGNGDNWISLPKKVGLNRCGKSCRLRWLNYLRPDIKHGDFTDEEDRLIHTLYHTIGSRWSVIASYLPGRTDNDVKNYWNTKLKRKILAGKFKNILPNSDITTNNNNNQFQLHPGCSQSDEIKVERSSVSQEICSYGDYNSDQRSSSSSLSSISMNSSNTSDTEDDEFWMDLLSESFDDVVAGILLEEKINEIASLLDA